MSGFKAFGALANISVVLFTVVWPSSVLAREETVKLLPSDFQVGGFGQAVAIDGDRIVVGAPFGGVAYIFHRNGSDWIEEQRINASFSENFDQFGESVAIDDDLLVVGAPHLNIFFPGVGKAFVFRRTGSTWAEEARLISSGSEIGDEFGTSVSISDGRVAIGARREGVAPGTVYVFRDDGGGTWVEEARLTPSDAVTGGAAFGWSVSMDGDLLLIGAWGDDSACPGDPGCQSGAAYVFRRSASNWVEEAKLVTPNFEPNDRFGWSVSLRDRTAIIGAKRLGAAYLYQQQGGVWTQEAKLEVSGVNGVRDEFANSVAVDGTTAIVGAPGDWRSGLQDAGSAFLFCRSGTFWREIDILLASDMAARAGLGFSVAVDGTYAVVGVFGGQSAYVYDLSDVQPCPLPTASQWGLCILALILIVGAKLLFFSHLSTSYSSCPTRFTGILAIAGFLSCSETFAQGPDLTAPHHPEHILVRFKPGTLDETRQLANAAVGATDLVGFRYVSGLYLVKVDPESLNGAIVTYLERDDVLYAEPDYELTLHGFPNDPGFSELWGLDNTGQTLEPPK